MIFYGTNASRLKDGRLNNVTCPNCNNNTTMNYSVFGKYAYIYWIPLFPTGKENVLECTSCNKTYKLKELPDQIKHKFETEKYNGVPLKHFAGLGIIAVLAAFLMYTSQQHDADVETYIQDPQVGDVYTLEGEQSGYHSAMRITEVTADSVYALMSDYEYNTTRLSELDKDENYSGEIYAFSKEDILTLFAEEAIEDINRD